MSIETLKSETTGGTIHPDLTKPQNPHPPNSDLPQHDKIVFFAGKMDEIEVDEEKIKDRKKRLKQQMMNQGIEVGMMKRVRDDLLQDPETVLEREAAYRHYMLAFDSPVGTQLSLFPAAAGKRELSQKELLDKAFKRGYVLGVNGKDPDEQAYPIHTDLGQEHRRGWQAGQKVNTDYLLMINEQSDAEEENEAQEKEKKVAEAKRKKDEKAAEAKKKTEEAAAKKRDEAAKKAAAKETKAAKAKAAKEEKAAKKKAATAAKTH